MHKWDTHVIDLFLDNKEETMSLYIELSNKDNSLQRSVSLMSIYDHMLTLS